MSDQYPPPPPQQPNWQPPAGADPKAAAKAAQAYAKASRPWFKKKRFIIPIAAVVIGGAAAAGSGGGKDDKGSQKEPSSASQPANQNDTTPTSDESKAPAKKPESKPDNSSKGKGAITWGNWEAVGRIQVSKNALDLYEVKLRVKNISDDTDTGIFTVNMLKGTEILGQADCTTPDIPAGSIGTANCFSGDDFKKGWTEITIEDSF